MFELGKNIGETYNKRTQNNFPTPLDTSYVVV